LKILFSAIFITNVLISTVFSAADAELKLLSQDKYLRVGRIAKVTLTSQNTDLINSLKKNNRGVSLGEDLYLYSVDFIQEEDKNNILVGASVILKQIPQAMSLVIKLDEHSYQLQLMNIEFHPDDKGLKAQSLIFQEQYTLLQFMNWLKKNAYVLLLAVGLLLLLGSVLGHKLYVKHKEKQLYKMQKTQWKSVIEKAQTRKELEYIYQHRKKWNKFFSNAACEDFINYLNAIQYSPEWSENELALVVEKLESMRKTLA